MVECAKSGSQILELNDKIKDMESKKEPTKYDLLLLENWKRSVKILESKQTEHEKRITPNGEVIRQPEPFKQ